MTDDRYDDALARRLLRRSRVAGELSLPAVPSLLERYVGMCAEVFGAVGRPFDPGELEHLRTSLRGQLEAAFAASPRSSIVITYEAPVAGALSYVVRAAWKSLGDTYDDWVATREPPLFGTEPDARVWDLATVAPDPTRCRILDIGGGTGRNALPLARRGHPVDVVELAPAFAQELRTAAAAERLPVRVVQRDVFEAGEDLRSDYSLIVLSEVLPDFRSTDQVRTLFELCAERLVPGGCVVFNVFLADPTYAAGAAVRELGLQLYSSVFTREELAGAAAGLPIELVSDQSVLAYERSHLPDEAWPPTSWYADWITGRDVFLLDGEDPPIELRWLVYQRVKG